MAIKFGNNLANTMHGTARVDILFGNGGNDTLYGGRGNDLILGGSGDDRIFGQAGDDWLLGQEGRDELYGGDGDDFLDSGPDPSIYDIGFENRSILAGGRGNDSYIVFGEPGDGLYQDVRESPGEGRDTIYGFGLFSALPDNVEDLILVNPAGGEGAGNGLDNLIRGDDGENYIFGLGGNDTLIGGGGPDPLYGGDGADWFVIEESSDGTDLIMDYEYQEGDRIVFAERLFDADLTEYGQQQFEFVGATDNPGVGQLAQQFDNGNTRIFGNLGNDQSWEIVLYGTEQVLTSDSFLFL